MTVFMCGETNNCFYPFLNLINNTLDVRNTIIHISVEQKPMYTEGSVIGQPLASIDLIDSVDCVNGSTKLIDFITACIPSTGHIIPTDQGNYYLFHIRPVNLTDMFSRMPIVNKQLYIYTYTRMCSV